MDEKYKLLGNSEKILKFFENNSIEKLSFYLFLEKLLLKIEPSEITSFFYNNFFQFFGGGGDVPCVPPWRGHCIQKHRQELRCFDLSRGTLISFYHIFFLFSKFSYFSNSGVVIFCVPSRHPMLLLNCICTGSYVYENLCSWNEWWASLFSRILILRSTQQSFVKSSADVYVYNFI